MARPRFQVTPEVLKEAERLAMRGLTYEQVARSLGISPETLFRYKRQDAAFRQAMELGRSKGVAVVANALYENAVGRRGPDGDYITPPDTRAQVAFLSRRDPENWSEQRRLELMGARGGPVRVQHSAEKAADILEKLLPDYADGSEDLAVTHADKRAEIERQPAGGESDDNSNA